MKPHYRMRGRASQRSPFADAGIIGRQESHFLSRRTRLSGSQELVRERDARLHAATQVSARTPLRMRGCRGIGRRGAASPTQQSNASSPFENAKHHYEYYYDNTMRCRQIEATADGRLPGIPDSRDARSLSFITSISSSHSRRCRMSPIARL